MKILKLSLENFQGIRSLTLDLDGNNAAIYGDNATGKTTVYNAVTWILFDKPSNGSKGFNPKTRGADGELHNLDHSAEMIVVVDNGERLTLKKTFKEVYKRKRGSLEEEFSGHTVDYFINGVPVKEREYSERVSAMCGNAGEALMMPNHFPEVMSWSDRRSILVSICGDVSDDEILTSSDDMRELSEILVIPGTDGKRYTVEDFKKIAAAKKTDINKRIASIPARIDEAAKAIPDTADIDPDKVADNVRKLDEMIADLERTRTEASRNAVDTSALDNLKAQKETAKTEHIRRWNAENEAINAEIAAAQVESREAIVKLTKAKNELAEKESECKRMTVERKALHEEYKRISDAKFSADDTVCPTCHRRLPEERIDDLRAEFGKRRRAKLEEIVQKGQAVSETKINALTAEINTLRESIADLEADYALKSERVTVLNTKIAVVTPFEQTTEAKELNRLIEEETAKLATVNNDRGEKVEEINALIYRYKAERNTENEKLAAVKLAKIQRDRIAELEAEEKTLGAEYSDLERSIYLCEQFTRAKVSALDSRINSRFDSVRFRLFEEQINGGLRDCCDVMIPRADGVLVPYMFANTAARINAGLEIISVLSAHFGASLPVIVDNAESVTALREIPAQVVRLIVSEADKKLRIEI